MAANTKELLADGLTLLYWTVAQATEIPEWELRAPESKEFADKIQGFVSSLDPVSAKKFEKFAGKVFPGAMLLGTAAVITWPRMKITREVVRQRRESARSSTQQRPATENGQRSTERSAENMAGHTATPSDAGAHSANGVSGREFVARPLTSLDVDEIVIRSDEPSI